MKFEFNRLFSARVIAGAVGVTVFLLIFAFIVPVVDSTSPFNSIRGQRLP